jgi:light-regulated signal transduction histidine kinase (bacteriophytochrome)
MEEELEDRARGLAYANKELESFTYSASHDLSAPLSTIMSFSGILLEDYTDVLDETGEILLRGIAKSAKKMKVLIDDLLRLSKISQHELSLEEVNLRDIAFEVIHELRCSEPQRSVEVIIQKNLSAHADPHLLQIVLTNLLGNAWKYTGKKGNPIIEFRSYQENGKEVFFIRDNGDGFDMTFAHKLFVPFQRLHSDSDFSGSGIGLAIVDRIITRHKGRIWAEAEKGKGATFYFTLK